jgi:uncharacterized membrane protein (UPF0127 family)
MKDTLAALTGVWVGAAGGVIGYWRGRPRSLELHSAPAPVSAVIEYPVGSRLPYAGAPVKVGGACFTQDRRL